MMRILVLGGTKFVGRHIVEAAVDGGHEVTLFNRGQTDSGLFADLERRRGDREASDLGSLAHGEWDAVIDVNGYIPRHVRESAGLLAGRVGVYCFISTGSVYAERGAADTDEDDALAELDGDEGEQYTDRTYGPLKVRCEQAVCERFPDGALVIRPGIVAGPHDGSERFTYWVRRMRRPGPVLGPQRPDQPVQVVHARDQAEFVVQMLAGRRIGTFNTVGEQVTFSELIGACAAAAGVTPDVVWAPDDLLREEKVNLPLSVPATGRWDGVFRRSNARARAAGFVNRPLTELAADTLTWDAGRDTPMALSADREAEVLARTPAGR